MALFHAKPFAGWISARVDALDSTDAKLLARLFKTYFRRFRARLAVIGVLILVISATTAGIALLVKDVVNEIFVDQSGLLFLPLFIAVLVIFFAKGGATYYQSVMSARISNEIVADVHMRMFEHVLRQRMSFYSRYGTDDLLTRFNQGADGFRSILTTVLINGIRDFWQVAALLAVMFWQDPILSSFSLVVSPVVYYGVVVLLKKIGGLVELQLAGHTALNKRVRELVQGIAVVKSFALERAAGAGAREVVDGLLQRSNKIAMFQTAPIPLLDAVGGIAVGLAVLYAGARTSAGNYDAGTFMSFLTALLLAADPARRLSQTRVALRTSFQKMKMVYDMLDDDDPEPAAPITLERPRTSVPSGAKRLPPSIELSNVGFSYAEESPVLAGFSLRVEPGETVALVGPSGAGKSTVFKLLLKFYEPTSGQILVDGTDLREIDTAALRGMFGYVGQSNFMFAGSIRDNLALMDQDVPLETIEAACAQVGLDRDLSALPQGYDTGVGELGALISGGQAQRLNLARAIIRDAPVLLLDEVTSALDAENEQRIKQVVERMGRRKTVLVIAHRLSTVKEADRIALMRDGRVIDIGPHDELIRKSDYYERLVALQFA